MIKLKLSIVRILICLHAAQTQRHSNRKCYVLFPQIIPQSWPPTSFLWKCFYKKSSNDDWPFEALQHVPVEKVSAGSQIFLGLLDVLQSCKLTSSSMLLLQPDVSWTSCTCCGKTHHCPSPMWNSLPFTDPHWNVSDALNTINTWSYLKMIGKTVK